MHTLSFHGSQFFDADVSTPWRALVRKVSQFLTGPVERIANACDVAGLLAARRSRQPAGRGLFRAAGREGHRSRRGGMFGCFHYLSDLS